MNRATADFLFLGSFGHGDEKIGQIDFQIAAVSHSLFGLDVQPMLTS